MLALLTIASSAASQEVAYAYSEFGGRPLESGNITEYNGTDRVNSSIAVGSISAPPRSAKTLEDMKREICSKVIVNNSAIIDKGRALSLEFPGDGCISQICSIYEYMVGNWSYLRDPLRSELFQFSNKSLEYGKGKYSGQGDCDDFAILLAALMESVGATPRIIFAYGPKGGHAYTEVLLGIYSGEDSDVGCMLRWLRERYDVQDINTHKDLKTGEVWLNMDWWRERGGAKHPGGPFFAAVKQSQICPDGDESKAYLTPVNELPIAHFSISPSSPNAKQNVIFNASSSKDACGIIETYRWEFGDGGRDEGRIVEHAYMDGRDVKAILEISDDDGTSASYSMDIKINQLPIPDIGYNPGVPIVGENITFSAIGSRDIDGHIVGYEWEFEDGNTSTMSRQVHSFDKRGNKIINLTVIDDKNARNTTSIVIRVNEPPHSSINFMPINPYAGEDIVFNATSSSDSDGLVMEYQWDLGDGSQSFGPIVYHNYKNGGNYAVELTIKDNDGAMSKNSSFIRIKKSEILSQEWLVKADEIFKQGMCDEAIKAYNASYATDPYNSKALFGKGRAYYAKGEYDVALQWLTAAIESTQYTLSNSDYADMWMYKSKALEELGQDLEADYALDKAEELDPSRLLEPVVESCAYQAPSPFNETVSKP